MARKLSEFPKPVRRAKYPWDQWLDGSVWELQAGEDYDTTTASMRASASRAAKELGRDIKTQIVRGEDGSESLIIQAVDEAD
jgi:hypothetical protein